MAKRKYGDGSVFQRHDGRWEGRLVIVYKENGYAKTQTDTFQWFVCLKVYLLTDFVSEARL